MDFLSDNYKLLVFFLLLFIFISIIANIFYLLFVNRVIKKNTYSNENKAIAKNLFQIFQAVIKDNLAYEEADGIIHNLISLDIGLFNDVIKLYIDNYHSNFNIHKFSSVIEKNLNIFQQQNELKFEINNSSFPQNLNFNNLELQNSTLNHITITQSYFSYSNFMNTNIENSNFSGNNFLNCFFQNSELKNSNFINSQFFNVDFSNSCLENVDFANSNLADINFTNSILENVNFENATLKNVIFDKKYQNLLREHKDSYYIIWR